jgi:hypothetical protein
LRASNANTGNTKNKPNMRKAKMDASEPLARRSVGVMLGLSSRKEAGVEFIVTGGIVLHSYPPSECLRANDLPLDWNELLRAFSMQGYNSHQVSHLQIC